MQSMVIDQRAGKLILWLSRGGVLVATSLLLISLLSNGFNSELFSMSLFLLVLCGFGSLYKRQAILNCNTQRLSITHFLPFKIFEKTYSFEDFSSVIVRKQAATTEGSDITRQANTSYSTMMYFVEAHRKHRKKGQKNVLLKKCFDHVEAQDISKKANDILSHIS